MEEQIRIFDTTLRDGEQCPGASMNLAEKEEIARQLAKMNVDIIEAGFPISSHGDFDAVKLIAETVEGPVVAGLCRAKEVDINRAWDALKNAPKPRIHTFIATSDIHLQYKLKMSKEEVLKRAVESIQLAKSYVEDVEFSAEDATRSDVAFLCEMVEAAIEAGATTINIPDTVGYALPREHGKLFRTLTERVPSIGRVVLSAHCHDDLGLGVANSLAALDNGARQIECTINGIGERAGNASLEEIVMAIRTRRDEIGHFTNVNAREIMRTSRLVSHVTGFAVQPNKAIVGRNAFAHKAGIHQHGVIARPESYEIMDPRDVGLHQSELVLGKHSGRHAFEKKLTELGFDLDDAGMNKAFERFKGLADKKKDISDRDIESIVADEIYTVPEEFHLEYMHVVSGGNTVPSATIRIRRGDDVLTQAGVGVGSVDAVYCTIDALVDVPHKLTDYSVKSVTGGTDALGEVTVHLESATGNVFLGRGTSTDIIEASAKAYVQAINKLVYHLDDPSTHASTTP